MSTASRLLAELRRTETLPSYNEEAVRGAIAESQKLTREMSDAMDNGSSGDLELRAYLTVHFATIRRNRRALAAYQSHRANRIDSLRWHQGPVLTQEARAVMSAPEIDYFRSYSDALSAYLDATGMDVTAHTSAHRQTSVMVRALQDCGEVMTAKGSREVKGGELHFMARSDCEPLVRKGMMEIVNVDDA